MILNKQGKRTLCQYLFLKVRREEELRNKIKLMEEENRTKEQSLSSKDADKISMLEELVIRETLDKVRYRSTE